MIDKYKKMAEKLLRIKNSFEKSGLKANIKMKKIIYEVKNYNENVYKTAIELGLNEFEARILANRLDDDNNVLDYINPTFKNIMDYNFLKDVDIATEAIIKAIKNKLKILLVMDYDADGVSSAVIGSLFFKNILQYNNIDCIINKREYENGINNTLKNQILDKKPDMIILADHGSSSGDNLDYISSQGIQVIITDHHEISLTNPPREFVAFINPQRADCNYDKSISGCTVLYLLLLSISNKLNIDATSEEMQNILAITSITTISDSMKLNSLTNRAIVKTGLKIINSFKTDNWKRLLADESGIANYKTIGWKIAPIMNSASRMGNPLIAYDLFMQEEDRDIREANKIALNTNENRKKLQEDLFRKANDEYMIDTDNKYSVVSKIDDGLGIQGIIASKLVDKYKLPSVVFYYNSKNKTYQGSGRSNGKVNILNAYRNIENKHPDKVLKCGGHKEAAGITITEDFYYDFKKLFEIEVLNNNITEINVVNNNYIYQVDMELKSIDYSLYQSIQLLAPYGNSWEVPLFASILKINKVVKVSKSNRMDMYILQLEDYGGSTFETFYFKNEDEDGLELKENMRLSVVYELDYSAARGKGMTLNIKAMSEY